MFAGKKFKLLLMMSIQLIVSIKVISRESNNPLNKNILTLTNEKISDEMNKRVSKFILKTAPSKKRPDFCPLNNTNALKKAANSMDRIVRILKERCFKGENNSINQYLSGTTQLKESLIKSSKKANNKDDEYAKKSIDAVQNLEVMGKYVGNVFSSFNSLIESNSCKGLDKTPFFERLGGVIETLAQFSFYSAENITYPFGIYAVGSMLTFLSKTFKKRFNFDKDGDIETFKNLNCAYYSMRNKIISQDTFTIAENDHFKYYEVVGKSLLEDIKVKQENIIKAKKETRQLLNSFKENYYEKNVFIIEKEVYQRLVENLQVIEKSPYNKVRQVYIINDFSERTLDLLGNYIGKEDQKNESSLNFFYGKVKKILEGDLDKVRSSPIKKFKEESLPYFVGLITLSLESIEKTRRNEINLLGDIEVATIDKKRWSYQEVESLLELKDLVTRTKEIEKKHKEVKIGNNRLMKILKRKEWSSEDSNDGGILKLIKNLNYIRNQIYGNYGKQFIKKMAYTTKNKNKEFEKQYKKFEKNYLDENKEIYPLSAVHDDFISNACSNAGYIRSTWIHAQKTSELVYDFFVVNEDIIGGPDTRIRKYIKRENNSVLFARKFISTINFKKKLKNYLEEEKDQIEMRGRVYSLKDQNSIGIARESLDYLTFNNQKINIKDVENYLNNKKEIRKSTIYPLIKRAKHGNLIFKLYKNKKKALVTQKLYNIYNCSAFSNL